MGDSTWGTVCAKCGESGEDMLRCSKCRGVYYCGRDCQRADWKEHKVICRVVNVGPAQQVAHSDHGDTKALTDRAMVNLAQNPLHIQKMFQIFMSDDTSDDAVSAMKTLIEHEPRWKKNMVLFQSLTVLIQLPKDMILKRTSPLLVAIACGADPSAVSRPPPPHKRDNRGSTPLHWVAELAEPQNEASHVNQVILGTQLLEAGANVNAEAESGLSYVTPLHRACHSAIVTNVNFIRLLLDHGANPNAQTRPERETPLMHALEAAQPAAKLLLTYKSKVPIDVDVRTANGSTFLGGVRQVVEKMQMMLMMSGGAPQHVLLVKQWAEIEQILVSMNAVDNGWTSCDHPNEPANARQPTNTPLSYDVGVLLDKDLLKKGPLWYRKAPFWVDDGTSIQTEMFKSQPMLHSGCNKGTYDASTVKKPAVGQGLEISVVLANHRKGERFGSLTGHVTVVKPEPTVKEFKKSGSYLLGKRCACGNPQCAITATGTRDAILEKFGCLHTQEVVGVVSLTQQSRRDDPVYAKFFRGSDTKYEVLLRCNDHVQNQWQVARMSITE